MTFKVLSLCVASLATQPGDAVRVQGGLAAGDTCDKTRECDLNMICNLEKKCQQYAAGQQITFQSAGGKKKAATIKQLGSRGFKVKCTDDRYKTVWVHREKILFFGRPDKVDAPEDTGAEEDDAGKMSLSVASLATQSGDAVRVQGNKFAGETCSNTDECLGYMFCNPSKNCQRYEPGDRITYKAVGRPRKAGTIIVVGPSPKLDRAQMRVRPDDIDGEVQHVEVVSRGDIVQVTSAKAPVELRSARTEHRADKQSPGVAEKRPMMGQEKALDIESQTNIQGLLFTVNEHNHLQVAENRDGVAGLAAGDVISSLTFNGVVYGDWDKITFANGGKSYITKIGGIDIADSDGKLNKPLRLYKRLPLDALEVDAIEKLRGEIDAHNKRAEDFNDLPVAERLRNNLRGRAFRPRDRWKSYFGSYGDADAETGNKLYGKFREESPEEAGAALKMYQNRDGRKHRQPWRALDDLPRPEALGDIIEEGDPAEGEKVEILTSADQTLADVSEHVPTPQLLSTVTDAVETVLSAQNESVSAGHPLRRQKGGHVKNGSRLKKGSLRKAKLPKSADGPSSWKLSVPIGAFVKYHPYDRICEVTGREKISAGIIDAVYSYTLWCHKKPGKAENTTVPKVRRGDFSLEIMHTVGSKMKKMGAGIRTAAAGVRETRSVNGLALQRGDRVFNTEKKMWGNVEAILSTVGEDTVSVSYSDGSSGTASPELLRVAEFASGDVVQHQDPRKAAARGFGTVQTPFAEGLIRVSWSRKPINSVYNVIDQDMFNYASKHLIKITAD